MFLLRFKLNSQTYMDRAVESDPADDIKERVRTWNELLGNQANAFAKGCYMAMVFIFSSHHVGSHWSAGRPA